MKTNLLLLNSLIIFASSIFLLSCSNHHSDNAINQELSVKEQINGKLLTYLAQLPEHESRNTKLAIIRYFIKNNQYSLASKLLSQINPKTATTNLLLFQIAVQNNQIKRANKQLHKVTISNLNHNELILYYQLRAKINLAYKKSFAAALYYLQSFHLSNNKKQQQKLAQIITNLMPNLKITATNYNLNYAVSASLIKNFSLLKNCFNEITKSFSNNSSACNISFHPALSKYTSIIKTVTASYLPKISQFQQPTPNKKIAVLLPLSGEGAWAGKAVQDGIMSSYYINHLPLNNIDYYDTNSSKSSLELYNTLTDKNYQALIGPLLKKNILEISQEYDNLSIPMLALNQVATQTTGLYQLGLPPEQEMTNLSQLAIRNGHHRALIFYDISKNNQRLYRALKKDWLDNKRLIVKEVPYSNNNNIQELIQEALLIKESISRNKKITALLNINITQDIRQRNDFDIIFLISSAKNAKKIIPLLNYYYAYNIPIYINSTALNPGQPSNKDLNGVTFCQLPFLMPNNKKFSTLNNSLAIASNNFKKLFALGLDAAQFSQLITSPQTYLGATGKLTLTKENRFSRQLTCAKYTKSRRNPLQLITNHET